MRQKNQLLNQSAWWRVVADPDDCEYKRIFADRPHAVAETQSEFPNLEHMVPSVVGEADLLDGHSKPTAGDRPKPLTQSGDEKVTTDYGVMYGNMFRVEVRPDVYEAMRKGLRRFAFVEGECCHGDRIQVVEKSTCDGDTRRVSLWRVVHVDPGAEWMPEGISLVGLEPSQPGTVDEDLPRDLLVKAFWILCDRVPEMVCSRPCIKHDMFRILGLLGRVEAGEPCTLRPEDCSDLAYFLREIKVYFDDDLALDLALSRALDYLDLMARSTSPTEVA